MTEMPLSLQTLPLEALDILRYFGATGAMTAHADDIIDSTQLTDRGFGKGVRRLVTRNYLSMSGEQRYRLTEQGQRAVESLQEYEGSAPATASAQAEPPEPRFIRRRLVLAAPKTLLAGQPTNVFVGVDDAAGEELLHDPLSLMIRLATLNGDPAEAQESSLVLSNRNARQVYEITPGYYTHVRVRVQVLQFPPDDEDVEPCGGLYVDLPVTDDNSAADNSLTAYGADIILKEYALES